MGQLCHPTMGITDVEHIENFDNGIIEYRYLQNRKV